MILVGFLVASLFCKAHYRRIGQLSLMMLGLYIGLYLLALRSPDGIVDLGVWAFYATANVTVFAILASGIVALRRWRETYAWVQNLIRPPPPSGTM